MATSPFRGPTLTSGASRRLMGGVTGPIRKNEREESDPFTSSLVKKPGYDVKKVFGYARHVSADDLKNLWERNSAARGIVDRIAGACWSAPFRISDATVEETDEFEENMHKVFSKAQIYNDLEECDKRSMICGWSVALLMIGDGKDASEPVEPGSLALLGGPESLHGVVPVWRTDITPKFGESGPERNIIQHWEYNTPSGTQIIHPDRALIVSDTGRLDAGGTLIGVYDDLQDYKKSRAGIMEMAWEAGRLPLFIRLKDGTDRASLDTDNLGTGETGSFQQKVSSTMHRFKEGSITGICAEAIDKVEVLANERVDAKAIASVSERSIAVGVNVATNLLFGKDDGSRAAELDYRRFNADMESRRERVIGRYLQNMLDKFESWGILPDPETKDWRVIWPPLNDDQVNENIVNAERIANINRTQADTMAPPAFTTNEIRKTAKFPELSEDEMEDMERDYDERSMREAAAEAGGTDQTRIPNRPRAVQKNTGGQRRSADS